MPAVEWPREETAISEGGARKAYAATVRKGATTIRTTTLNYLAGEPSGSDLGSLLRAPANTRL